MAWQKPPPELVEAFHRAVARRPEIAVRKMFGYPAGFVGGHMVTGLFESSWFVRLDEPGRDELLALEGAAPFSPMPGRPMTGYVVLPPSVVAEPAALDAWLERAVAVGRGLPPKQG